MKGRFYDSAIILSIPYWDFLVLNLCRVGKKAFTMLKAFNSLLGFSSFESGFFQVSYCVPVNAFNSLLGFSSFESKGKKYTVTIPKENFQFPIGIF